MFGQPKDEYDADEVMNLYRLFLDKVSGETQAQHLLAWYWLRAANAGLQPTSNSITQALRDHLVGMKDVVRGRYVPRESSADATFKGRHCCCPKRHHHSHHGYSGTCWTSVDSGAQWHCHDVAWSTSVTQLVHERGLAPSSV